jgi:hypothetical protein
VCYKNLAWANKSLFLDECQSNIIKIRPLSSGVAVLWSYKKILPEAGNYRRKFFEFAEINIMMAIFTEGDAHDY